MRRGDWEARVIEGGWVPLLGLVAIGRRLACAVPRGSAWLVALSHARRALAVRVRRDRWEELAAAANRDILVRRLSGSLPGLCVAMAAGKCLEHDLAWVRYLFIEGELLDIVVFVDAIGAAFRFLSTSLHVEGPKPAHFLADLLILAVVVRESRACLLQVQATLARFFAVPRGEGVTPSFACICSCLKRLLLYVDDDRRVLNAASL